MITTARHEPPPMTAWAVDPEITTGVPDDDPLVVDPAAPEMAADSGEPT
jgi:hypothetical protein